jgi:alanine-glyoxylate transaminase/serine-glyoxylate transaminase/serine-pyruvate transaminase
MTSRGYIASVPTGSRVLMGPGPSNPYPGVMEALGLPLLGHLDPEFLELLDEVCDRLKTVFATSNRLTLPVSGTGSAGMEAAFVNVVHPGDVVVVGVNGMFGERMCDIAGRLGAKVVRVEAPWGSPLDVDDLLSAHGSPSVIALVHAETSTGVRNDVELLAGRTGDALLIVDCVTSLGGIPVEIDGWGIDVAYSATQKCLGVPPGLAPLTASDRARERFVSKPVSWYLDLAQISNYTGPQGSGAKRVYHHTAPVAMVRALHAGLGYLLSEGLEAAWSRHVHCGAMLAYGLDELGLELVVEPGHRLPQLTTVWVPEDIPGGKDEAEVRAELLNRYSIEIGAGVGPFASKVWRIGCMGGTARPENVELLLGALAEVLGR